MSGEFVSRKDSQSRKFEQRPQIFVKPSFRELCNLVWLIHFSLFTNDWNYNVFDEGLAVLDRVKKIKSKNFLLTTATKSFIFNSLSHIYIYISYICNFVYNSQKIKNNRIQCFDFRFFLAILIIQFTLKFLYIIH